MARVVIADAGPLIAFTGIDRLVILKQLFAEVIVLQSVIEECLAKEGADAQRVKLA
jgi:predicted nucleic acid-binding protein